MVPGMLIKTNFIRIVKILWHILNSLKSVACRWKEEWPMEIN
jgi:hypothetical protein